MAPSSYCLCVLLLGCPLLLSCAEGRKYRGRSSGRASDSSSRLSLHVIRHGPCRQSRRQQFNEKIVFPSINTAPIQKIQSRPGCYYIGGRSRNPNQKPIVAVKKKLGRFLEVFVKMKYSLTGPDEKCYHYDNATGCGGWGSCLFCDGCTKLSHAKQSQRVAVRVEGKPIDCNTNIKVGNHDNVELAFCLPTKREFSQSQGIPEADLDRILTSRGFRNEVGVFLQICIFDRPVHLALRNQRLQEEHYMKLYGLDFVPQNIKNNFEFSKLMGEGGHRAEYVGCHKVFGNLKIGD